MSNQLLREALEEMVRCAQKQNWRDNYPSAMDKAYAALEATKETQPAAGEPVGWMRPDGSSILTALMKRSHSEAWIPIAATHTVPVYAGVPTPENLSEALSLLREVVDEENDGEVPYARIFEFLLRAEDPDQQRIGDFENNWRMVYQYLESKCPGWSVPPDNMLDLVVSAFRTIILDETQPAAAHGDEAVLDVLKTAYESGYQDGQGAPNAYSDEKVKHRIALSLLEEMMADAAMRAQGDGGKA